MESNIKGLVSAGHEMASELKAECGAVDMRSVGMLTNLNYEAMKTLLGERIMDRMTMNGGRWVNFNWESWRPNVVQPGIAK